MQYGEGYKIKKLRKPCFLLHVVWDEKSIKMNSYADRYIDLSHLLVTTPRYFII